MTVQLACWLAWFAMLALMSRMTRSHGSPGSHIVNTRISMCLAKQRFCVKWVMVDLTVTRFVLLFLPFIRTFMYPGCQRFYFSFARRERLNGEAKNANLWSRRLRNSLPCKFGIRYLAKPVFCSDVNVVPNSSPLGIERLILTVPIGQQPIKSDMKTTN